MGITRYRQGATAADRYGAQSYSSYSLTIPEEPPGMVAPIGGVMGNCNHYTLHRYPRWTPRHQFWLGVEVDEPVYNYPGWDLPCYTKGVGAMART